MFRRNLARAILPDQALLTHIIALERDTQYERSGQSQRNAGDLFPAVSRADIRSCGDGQVVERQERILMRTIEAVPVEGVPAGQEVGDQEDRIAKVRCEVVEELAPVCPELLDASRDALEEKNGAVVVNQCPCPAQDQVLK